MATIDKERIQPPAETAFWVFDTKTNKEIKVGTYEDCMNYAARNSRRYRVFPNN